MGALLLSNFARGTVWVAAAAAARLRFRLPTQINTMMPAIMAKNPQAPITIPAIVVVAIPLVAAANVFPGGGGEVGVIDDEVDTLETEVDPDPDPDPVRK